MLPACEHACMHAGTTSRRQPLLPHLSHEQVPGAILLRDPSGSIYAVQTETVQQVDLSDDYICLLMFADGGWEKQMSPIEYAGEDGKTQQLKVSVQACMGAWGAGARAERGQEGAAADLPRDMKIFPTRLMLTSTSCYFVYLCMCSSMRRSSGR
jgi:hypothetical protein